MPADIYLIDEPSAMLDAEQRLVAAKIIKRYAHGTNSTIFPPEIFFTINIVPPKFFPRNIFF
jgi:translation initiation factor RLI1